jgi:putative RecB family exonuclease
VQSTFSHSSLGSFENCPRQYWFRYVAKVTVETESIEAFVGKRVHEILERLYRFVGRGMVPSLERVLWRYNQTWDENFDAERVRIERTGTEPDFYRSHGERCLTNYYRRHYPFDADETLALERPVRFALDENGHYRVRGVIDRLVRAQDGALEIHDFKTGRRVPRQEELDRDRQLALYEIGVREELGERGGIRLVWHFALSNQQRTSVRSRDQLETLRDEIRSLIDRVRSERRWEPNPSALCDWCEFRDRCPAFAPEASGAEASRLPKEEEVPGDAETGAQLLRPGSVC